MNWLRRKLGFVKITVDGRVHYFWRYGKYSKLFAYLFTTYGSGQTTGNIRATEIRCDTTKRSGTQNERVSPTSRQPNPPT